MSETISLLGTNISLYYSFWMLGALIVLAGGYFLGKNLGYDFSKSVLYVAGTIIMGYLLLWATSWIFGGGKMSGLNFVRIATFLPVPIFLLTHLMKDSFKCVSDMLAPLISIFHGISHIGCIFPGCCHGYPSSWGLYSNTAEDVCFPIQLVEALSAILIGVILIIMLKKNIQQGRLYAWYLILYGSTRFVWEFFRDNEKIWHSISELAIHAIGAFILGTIMLIVSKSIFKKEVSHNE